MTDFWARPLRGACVCTPLETRGSLETGKMNLCRHALLCCRFRIWIQFLQLTFQPSDPTATPNWEKTVVQELMPVCPDQRRPDSMRVQTYLLQVWTFDQAVILHCFIIILELASFPTIRSPWNWSFSVTISQFFYVVCYEAGCVGTVLYFHTGHEQVPLLLRGRSLLVL